MKKIICNTLIIIIMLGVFCNGYFCFSGLSFSDRVSYAEADNWSDCDNSDLVTAFRYYCKSRNLAIEGSAVDALTSFTTTTFNNICSTLGIDPTSLSAELKKTTEGNLGLRYLFSNTGITAYNRIFSEFLQNNDLEVGDAADDKVIYSGDSYNGALVFNVASYPSSIGTFPNPNITRYGSFYLYSNDYVVEHTGQALTFGSKKYYSVLYNGTSSGVTYTGAIGIQTGSTTKPSIDTCVYGDITKGNTYSYTFVDGYPILYTIGSSSTLYLGIYFKRLNNLNNTYQDNIHYQTAFDAVDDLEPVDITLNTNNTTINNNTYNNNYTIIFNDGDTYISDDDDEPLPTTPPGGGGNVDPDPDDPLDPYDPTKPFPDTPDNPTPDPGVHGSPGSDGTITIPDFNFDLPDINWSLDGLQHKFPFSLPFDLYNACKLLNAEPQTPELDYTVNLVVYQWPIQMDLHWLDPAARVIRIFELLAFVVGLILITRHLIGG